ncbi:hypothetical protein HK099_000277 [Clydaea vesicula]|uniref:SF3 helicase domain-containing protein n=1 Tax=Clydaea vesicula TaxID=447962 RepID=A0AAD5U4C6_9FUNG|nr:hypothetical protein HK099_000277 [Clydaea vesicula]
MSASRKRMDSDTINKIIQQSELNRDIHKYDNLEAMYNYHNNLFSMPCIQSTRYEFDVLYRSYNEEQYLAWKSWMLESKMTKLADNQKNESLIADAFYETICNSVFVSDNGTWYFINGQWTKDNGQHLWILLTKDFHSILSTYHIPCITVLQFLSKVSVRKNIISDVKSRLYSKNLLSKLNASTEIIGVANGILELKTGVVREPVASDFVTLSTECIYREPDEHTEVSLLMHILQQTFPTKETFKFFIRHCSSFLEGYNSTKAFFIWWGTGNNCKTGMQTLVQSALGQYCGTAPVSLLTSKRSGSGNPTPELNHLEGKLIIFLQEPNQREELKTGRVKELTGNDRMYTRGLFEKEPREISVKCKLVLVANYPNINQNTDSAFKRRIYVQPFDSVFLPPEEYADKYAKGLLAPYTYEIDNRIEKLFVLLGPAFLWLLVKEYSEYLKHGLEVPDVVKTRTEEFLTHNNYCLKYIRKYITQREVERDEVGVDSNSLYEIFKSYMVDFFPGKQLPSSEMFCTELQGEGYVEDENGFIKGHDYASILSDIGVSEDVAINIVENSFSKFTDIKITKAKTLKLSSSVAKGTPKKTTKTTKGTNSTSSNVMNAYQSYVSSSDTPDWQVFDANNNTYICTNVMLDNNTRSLIADSSHTVFVTKNNKDEPVELSNDDKAFLASKNIRFC